MSVDGRWRCWKNPTRLWSAFDWSSSFSVKYIWVQKLLSSKTFEFKNFWIKHCWLVSMFWLKSILFKISWTKNCWKEYFWVKVFWLVSSVNKSKYDWCSLSENVYHGRENVCQDQTNIFICREGLCLKANKAECWAIHLYSLSSSSP